MKKILSILGIFVFALVLGGCSLTKEKEEVMTDDNTMVDEVSDDTSLTTIEEELSDTQLDEFDAELDELDEEIDQL